MGAADVVDEDAPMRTSKTSTAERRRNGRRAPKKNLRARGKYYASVRRMVGGWRSSLVLVGALGALGAGACAAAPGGAPARADETDAGPPPDAAAIPPSPAGDAAPPPPDDAAPPPPDAAPPRADQPAIACEDALDAAYVTPVGLPPLTSEQRGDVVRCAPDTGYASAGDAQAAIAAKGIALTATSGARVYRILYRTTRGDGSAGVSSARVYLPTVPRALPLPVIAVGHPSEGIAASCTPSKIATSNRDLALPWAALGYAVIVPDYAGLGTDGVQAYLDNRDQAYSLLDGARALRKLLAKGALSDKVALFGYSQGGGAALSAQALARTYGADGTVAAVVAFAPQWATRMNSFGYVSILRNPGGLTITTGLSKSAIAVLREYAYFGNHGAPPASGFPASKRSGLGGAITSMCLVPLGGYIQAFEPRLGDLVDDGLRTSLLACVDANGVGCAEPGASFYAFLSDNVLHADPQGAPVLIVQGLADQIMLPAEEAACTIDKLVAEGVTPDVCTDPVATHATVLPRNVMNAIGWTQAKLGGTAPPACTSTGMPACTP